MKRIREEHTFF